MPQPGTYRQTKLHRKIIVNFTEVITKECLQFVIFCLLLFLFGSLKVMDITQYLGSRKIW